MDNPVSTPEKPNVPIVSPANESGANAPDSPATTTTVRSAWMGGFAAYARTFDQIKRNPQPAYLFIAVYTILAVLSSFTGDTTSRFDMNYKSYEDIAWLVFLLALPVYGLALADRKSVTIAEVMRFDVSKFFYMLGAYILATLIFIVSALPLLIPLIWTIAWFSMFEYPVVDKGYGPIQALKESKRLAENHKAKVWGLIGVTIVIGILSAILSFVPVIGGAITAVFGVISTGAFAVLYRWLQREQPETPVA